MIRRASAVAGVWLACMSVQAGEPVAAEVPVRIEEHRQSYVVDALELDRLREQIDQERPERRDGRASHGLLAVDIGVHYRLLPVADGCRLAETEVQLSLTLSLPEWQPRGEPPVALKAAWDQMHEGLARHEAGHRQMALDTARELAAGIAALGATATDCGVLRRRLLAARLSHLSRLSLRSAAYDRRTGHGERQGAVLDIEVSGLNPCERRETLMRHRCNATRR